jgi:hypothetical protein
MKKIVDSEELNSFFDSLEDVSETMLDSNHPDLLMVSDTEGKLELILGEGVKTVDLHEFILGEFFDDDNPDTDELNKDLFLGIENLYKESKKFMEKRYGK